MTFRAWSNVLPNALFIAALGQALERTVCLGRAGSDEPLGQSFLVVGGTTPPALADQAILRAHRRHGLRGSPRAAPLGHVPGPLGATGQASS